MDIPSYRDNTYFMGQEVFVKKMIYHEQTTPHTHDFIEFVYMLNGQSLHTVNGVEYPLESGELLIINYDEVHFFTADPNVQFYNILIKPTAVDKSLESSRDLFSLLETNAFGQFKNLVNNECRFIRFSPEERNCFQYILGLLEKEMRSQETGYDLTLRAGSNFLLTMIFRKMQKSINFVPSDFKQLLKYIRENYAESICVESLANKCHYNPSYFSRVFKKHTGKTFSEYLKGIRITESCRLIEAGSELSDLHLRVGYTNKTNFYKHFRQLTGTTPMGYKKVKK